MPEPRGRILIVDDELIVLELLRLVLGGAGYEVVCCQGGHTALTLLDQEHFDGILCDLSMPDLTGMDVHARLREAGSPLADRFIFLTGNVADSGMAEFVARCGAPCLTKPFNLDRLQTLVAARFDPQPVGPARR